MPIHLKKITLAVLPLAGLLLMAPLTFAHEGWEHRRVHHNLNDIHEDFHSQSYTAAEHRRLHEDLQDLHEEEHGRAHYGDRSYDRNPYYGGGPYYNRPY